MTFNELWDIFNIEIPEKIVNHKGLNYFVSNRSKFEGWLKVEIVDILTKYTNNITPEKDRIDIVVEDWAIELKTSNTNYRYDNVENKKRPVTKNVSSIIKDINDLEHNVNYENKAVLFIIFPLDLTTPSWNQHIQKIENELDELKFKEFSFENGVKSILYFGLVKGK